MTTVSLRFPTDEEEERSRRFQVNKNYLGAIAQFLDQEYGDQREQQLSALLSTQRSLPGFRRIQRAPTARASDIARFLRIAWASEIQLRLGFFGRSTYLRYSNAWAPVHAYYAVYMATHAWFAAMKFGPQVDDHSSSLKTVSNNLRSRGVFPLPWRVTCSGCPQLDECVWEGLPPEVDPKAHVELLSNPSLEDFWPRYCKMLKTTRERRLERRFEEWRRRNNRKNIRTIEKRLLDKSVWPTTIFDVLFRLRVRSNYKDIASFLMSAVSSKWQEDFLTSLVRATDATTLLLEALVIQHVGPTVYRNALDDFLKEDVEEIDEPAAWLLERRDLLVA